MGKLINALLLIMAIQLSTVLFLGVPPVGSSLWQFVTGGFDWSATSLVNLFVTTIALIGVGGAIIGASVGFKYDFLIFAGISGTFLSFGMSIWELYQKINAWPSLGTGANYLAMIVIAPIALIYIYVVLKFWRGND